MDPHLRLRYEKYQWAIGPFLTAFGADRVVFSEQNAGADTLSLTVYRKRGETGDRVTIWLLKGREHDVNSLTEVEREEWLEQQMRDTKRRFMRTPPPDLPRHRT